MKRLNNPTRSTEQGAAIIYVFIGIILFAALAFTFSRSAQNSSSALGTSDARVYAQEILTYGDSVQKAVQSILSNGFSEQQLDFDNPLTLKRFNGTNNPMVNARCTSTGCKVFNPQGGGVTPSMAPIHARGSSAGFTATYPAIGGNYPHMINIVDVGSTLPDLVFSVHGLSKNLCIELNKILGVDNPSGNPPTGDATAVADQYNGSMTSSTTLGDSGEASLKGKTRFCMRYNTAVTTELYVYQHVLLQR